MDERRVLSVSASQFIGVQTGMGQHPTVRDIEFNKAPVGSFGWALHQIRALPVSLTHTVKVRGL